MQNKKQHVFIIGSKGIPAKYGGFESFVEQLTLHQKDKNIRYHVACLSGKPIQHQEYKHNNAHCFGVKVPNIGPAKAVIYDIYALKYCLKYIKKHHIENPIIYILACRIGPFISNYKKQLKKYNGLLFVNPDGHEWKRAKWNFLIRKYWKLSEKLMVKHADLLICDSKNIEKYIKSDYHKYKPKTTYIAYGADVSPSALTEEAVEYTGWIREHGLKAKEYYLIVGRFVPENNYETMIQEFMKSNTKKDLVIITNIEKNKFYNRLKVDTGFMNDKRIKFVGTVYEQELLKKIREQAFAYIHGHEVGGTNPSLLEALASTELNLLLDVGFNKEVGEGGALYWSKDGNNLAKLINELEHLSPETANEYEKHAKARIATQYSWKYIISVYESMFRIHRS